MVRVAAVINGLASMCLSGLSLFYFAKRHPPPGVSTHVRRVTVTYLAFVVYGMAEIVTHWSHDMRWQLLVLWAVFVLATRAQLPLLQYEHTQATKVQRGQLRRVGD